MSLIEKIEAAILEFKDFKPKPIDETPPRFNIAHLIDHTLLQPDATEADILKLCKEAVQYEFKNVCVNPIWIPLCRRILPVLSPKSVAVVDFPFGASLTPARAMGAWSAVKAGAKEIDLVIPLAQLRSGDYEYVHKDLKSVQDTVEGTSLKVILETSKLTHDQIVAACVICKEVGVAFVKTSTGFGGGGATVEDVALMKAVVGDDIGVKASGGIRTYNDAVRMLSAGASRIGASASVAIIEEQGDWVDHEAEFLRMMAAE
jgi:deoxyribose-phosphate aldolase